MNSINNNLMAGSVANTLNSHYKKLAISTERLSTGLRVNSAADDAAGLAIRELMRADGAALNQGMRNANDAISLLQTADSALGVIDEKLIRMKELAEQAATGTYNADQRLLIHSEFQAMASEINLIANATDFNGIHLLDGSLNGAHDGSGLESAGKMKIHFGSGNDSAEDYYYLEIQEATINGLFRGAGATREVLGFDPVVKDVEIPTTYGDNEGQSILALPNGNMLILTNLHQSYDSQVPSRSLIWNELDPQGNLINAGVVQRPAVSDGIIQPQGAIALPNGNVAIAFANWGTTSAQEGIGIVVYDSAWNVVSSQAILTGGRITSNSMEDMAISVTSGSLLAGGRVEGGNIVLAMMDASGTTPVTTPASPAHTITIAGTSAVSTTLDGKHFVVAQNGSNLEGHFVDDAGNTSGPISLCEGRGAKITSLGSQAVLTYIKTDAATNNNSSYGRVVNADGSVGEEVQLNAQDANHHNNVVDVAVMKDEDGNDLNQVLVAWKNSANNGTLKAEAFIVEDGKLVTSGKEDMEFVSGISGNGLGFANIAVLKDGSIAADWQKDLGGLDHNAFGVFKVRWGAGAGEVGLSIKTQAEAQAMLEDIDYAIARKDSIRANIGALANRLENTVANISIQAQNLQSAESRISDTDAALEMTEFVRTQILSQSALAMLGQANSYPHMLSGLIQS